MKKTKTRPKTDKQRHDMQKLTDLVAKFEKQQAYEKDREAFLNRRASFQATVKPSYSPEEGLALRKARGVAIALQKAQEEATRREQEALAILRQGEAELHLSEIADRAHALGCCFQCGSHFADSIILEQEKGHESGNIYLCSPCNRLVRERMVSAVPWADGPECREMWDKRAN